MATIRKFEDLDFWQMARELNVSVFEYFKGPEFSRDYKLLNQMNGSCGSIMDNIAEGFERDGNREFIQFLSISKASCGELRSQLYRALDRNYINPKQFEESYILSEKISGKISRFMSFLKQSEYKGRKYV